jgi:tRNA G26 N,N-dimethylase Trm1
MRFSHKDFFSSEQVYHGFDQHFYRSKIKLNTGSRRCVEYVHVTTMYVPRVCGKTRTICPFRPLRPLCPNCAPERGECVRARTRKR